MPTKMYYCLLCGFMTPHEVVVKNGIAATICQQCMLRWAKEGEAQEKHEENVKAEAQ